MKPAYIIAAKRTAVCPRGGSFHALPAHNLAAPVINALLSEHDLGNDCVDGLIMGNALYGGGNPTRVAGLEAGLSEHVPAMTIDTQCCSGMDAIALAAQQVSSGNGDVIIAGGLESWSRSPKRIKRALGDSDHDEEYERPPFTPWTERDPDMIDAAAQLAKDFKIKRCDQETFAMESHRKALALFTNGAPDIVAVNDISTDPFARNLTEKLCNKLPSQRGDLPFDLTSATIAIEADAAAAVLVVSEKFLGRLTSTKIRPVQFIHHTSRGADPENPALASITAANALFKETDINPDKLSVAEVMEAFAVQAMVCMDELGLPADITNLGGGALARGHPIGASGAINIVRLWHELQRLEPASYGMATIAAAGGLGSATLLRST